MQIDARQFGQIWSDVIFTGHESRGHQYAITLMCSLFHTTADEGDDIIEHLNKLKEAWEKLNMLDNKNFFIPDTQFKALLVFSLPPSWDIERRILLS